MFFPRKKRFLHYKFILTKIKVEKLTLFSYESHNFFPPKKYNNSHRIILFQNFLCNLSNCCTFFVAASRVLNAAILYCGQKEHSPVEHKQKKAWLTTSIDTSKVVIH